jgi:TP901 family phage tail tape measure protein|nr:MAG TPA: minor tail protein [Caudoviricetes sp.]
MAKSNALELSIRIAGKVDNSLTAAIKTAKNQTSGLARGVSTFAKTSAAALVGVTAAVVGVAATCGKQAADVEKAMAQTRTLLTGTADETKARTTELTQDVMNISRVTGRVSTEIAAGSYQVISAFQDTADTASILETATKAAIAGQAETVDTVNALAAVTKAYGDTSARAVTHVSDLSFETIRLGQTTMPELANGIQKASGSAATLHVSQEELYAGFATLTGVIGNTDTVGTALNTLYTKMLKPSKALSKAVESLGYKSAYAMVQQEGLGGTIKKLGQYAGGDATKFAALFSMRDLKAAQGILNTMDVYEQKLSELQDADGATDRAFMTSINNWNDMFGIASNKVSVFAQQVGMKLLPYAKDFLSDAMPKIDGLMDTVLAGIDKIMPKIEALFKYLSQNGPQVAGIASAVAAAWGGMIAAPKIETGVKGVASFLSSGLGKAKGGGAKLLGKAKGFGGSMLAGIKDLRANPGLIKSLPVFGWAHNVKNIPANAKQAVLNEINSSGSLLKVIGAGAGSVFGKGGLNVGGIAKGAASPFLGMGKVFLGMLSSTGPVIVAIGTIIALFSILGDHLDNIRGLVQNTFGEQGVAVFDGFVGAVQNVGATIQQALSPEGLAGIKDFITQTFGEGAGNAFGMFIPLIQSVAGIVGQLVDLGVNYLKPLILEVFNFMTTQALPALIPLLASVVSLVGTALVNAVKVVVGIVQTLLPIVEPVIMGIISLIQSIVSVTIKVVNGIIGALNRISFTVPDWSPVFAGKTFGFNLSEVAMPQFAQGGFTNGPSIAGEAGTEAVISFQRGVRQQNIDIWRMAGQMLGVQDNDGSMPQIVFSPNITISGDADPAEVTRKTKELFKLFEQFLDQYFRKHNKVAYSR